MASHFSLETAAAFKISFFYYIRLPYEATPDGELIIRKNERPIAETKAVQIVYRLFLVNCYLLHVPRLPSQPASNVRG